MQSRMQYANKAVRAAADKPAIMDRLRKSGNPATRHASESLYRIKDYTMPMQYQHAMVPHGIQFAVELRGGRCGNGLHL